MGQLTILVVDDEKEICEVTCSFLAKRNYKALAAFSGDEALHLVNQELPQIVLLDMRLGGESGLDILTRIKEAQRDTHVIMITGLDDDESVRKAKELGADDYMTKPFTAAFLHELLLRKIDLWQL